MFGAVAQIVSQRKCDLYSVPALLLNRNIAVEPKTPVRPARGIAQQIFANFFATQLTLIVILDLIGKEIAFRADMQIQPGSTKAPT